jgi:TonB family protein
LVLTGAVLGGAAVGLLPISAVQAQVVPPRALEQSQPPPPSNRFGFPTEGWVVLRYTVQADGRTASVRVIDRMPPVLADRAAVEAVEAWTFEPATSDGEAIEWHNNESVIVFDLDEVPPEPSPFFLQAYLEADELIKAADYDKALSRNKNMQTTVTSRLAEVGLAQMQNAIVHLGLGDLHAARAAILRATDPRIPILQPDELKVALQYRSALELELGDVAAALTTFARRKEIAAVADDDPWVANAAALEEALLTDAPIAIKGKVLDDYWFHTPTRRTFALANVEGEIDGIRVECNRRGAELEYAADAEWTLPASWGVCSLMVEGSSDTEFVLYEFP